MLFKQNKVVPDNETGEHSQTQIFGNSPNLGRGMCRICWEEDIDMIKPCACTGSIELVHQKCMISWVEAQHKGQRQKIKCEICLEQIKFQYTTRYEWKPEKCEHNIQKINPCFLGLFLGSMVFLTIFAIVLRYGDKALLQGTGKFILIGGIVVMSVCSICLGIILFFVLLTERKYVIQEVIDRNGKIKSFALVRSDNSAEIPENVSPSYSSSQQVSSSAVPS